MHVVTLCGSLRSGSFNKKALAIAKAIATQHGASSITDGDIGSLPLYNGDIEDQGMPESVTQLATLIATADLVMIASPEYNHSISGVLKNALDWLSRGENPLARKVACIFGVSNGKFATVRGQAHLREVLLALNVLVLPKPEVLIGMGDTAFTPEGAFTDPKTHEFLETLIVTTIAFAEKMRK